MRYYAPFYLWAIVIAGLAFGLGLRVGDARAHGYTSAGGVGQCIGLVAVPHHDVGLLDWFRG